MSRRRHLIRVLDKPEAPLYSVNSEMCFEELAISYPIARRTKLRRKRVHFFTRSFFTVSCVFCLFSPRFLLLVVAIILIIVAFRLSLSRNANAVHIMFAARAASNCWRFHDFFFLVEPISGGQQQQLNNQS